MGVLIDLNSVDHLWVLQIRGSCRGSRTIVVPILVQCRSSIYTVLSKEIRYKFTSAINYLENTRAPSTVSLFTDRVLVPNKVVSAL